MDTFVEETLEWAPLGESDLPELAQLCEAVEYFDDPITRTGLEDLVESFHRAGADPGHNAICGRDSRSGNIVAYGWNHVDASGAIPRVIMNGAVHPGWRDQRIGFAIVSWQRARAREWATELPGNPREVWVGAYADDKKSSTQRLLRDQGLSPERYFFDLHHVFNRDDEDDQQPARLPGIDFVPYTAQVSEEVRVLHNLCFQDNPGFCLISTDTWNEMQDRAEFRPEWSWLAYAQGQLVGYALNNSDEQLWEEQGLSEGWTDRLGVHPAYRRLGVARALLYWSMWSFRRAGLEGAGLGLDSADADGLLQVLKSIGYENQEIVVLLSETVSLDVA